MKNQGARRVVITGVGIESPIGGTLDEAMQALVAGRSGVARVPAWENLPFLRPKIAGLVAETDFKSIPRKFRRSMGRVAELAAAATEKAVVDSGVDREWLSSGEVGISYGSTMGSLEMLVKYIGHLGRAGDMGEYNATSFLQIMSHTCAANLAQMYSIRGRMIAACSACTSGSQAIGFATEAIRWGRILGALAGGAEEVHFISSGTFDIMHGASFGFNDRPHQTPRPFDRLRDGLVVGEGAGTVLLEELDHARARGARIYGEVLGFGTNCDGTHITAPSADGMQGAMALALEDAGLAPSDIRYINAHATATPRGDVAEAVAVRELFGDQVPISSTKSLTGHTLGACGAIETAFCLAMMRDGVVIPTYNLDEVDPDCAGIRLPTTVERCELDLVMNNNFAFGGVNSSLVIGRQP